MDLAHVADPQLDPLRGATGGATRRAGRALQNGTGGVAGTATHASTATWPSRSTADFTAVRLGQPQRTDAPRVEIIGQRHPASASRHGWLLHVAARHAVPTRCTAAAATTASGTVSVARSTRSPTTTWALLAVTYDADADDFKLYVDGLLQGAADRVHATAPSADRRLWIGHDGDSRQRPLSPAASQARTRSSSTGLVTGAELARA